MNREKKTFKQVVKNLKVKEMIKNAKKKGIIKPVAEAFEKTPVEQEKHKGDANYFLN